MKTPLACLALLALLVAACSTFAVGSDYDQSFDFRTARSWQWADPPGHAMGDDPRARSDLTHQRIRRAIERELGAKGMQKRSSGAELWVAYHLGVERHVEVETQYVNNPAGRVVYVGVPEVTTREYERGTILVDLVRASDNHLVWRGTVSARLHERMTPQEREKRINEAIRAVMQKYPPR